MNFKETDKPKKFGIHWIKNVWSNRSFSCEPRSSSTWLWYHVLIVIGIIYLLGYMFWFNAFGNIAWQSAMVALLCTTAIFLIFLEFVSNSNGEPGWRQSLLHLKLAAVKWKRFNKKQILRRVIIKFSLMLAPLVLALIITWIFKVCWAWEDIVSYAMTASLVTGYLFYFAGNVYCFWTSKGNQFIHDKVAGIAIIDESVEEEI